MTRRARRALLFFAILASLVAGTASPAATVAGSSGSQAEATAWLAAPGSRPSAVILIGGLCSALGSEPGALPSAFSQPNGLAARLRAAGWTSDEILAYSYRGGLMDPAGHWTATPYDCDDSRQRTIAEDAATLDAQVRTYLARHPGTDIHVAGYSQGGLVALAYLAHLEKSATWSLPNDGRLASVVSLDSPLGGLPFVDAACGLVGDVCAAAEPGPTPPSLVDMSTIWGAGGGRPAGSERSIGRLFGLSISNQALAERAAGSHGVTVLTLGNVRDWVYAPIGLLRPVVNFVDTQWLRSGAAGSRVYARVIDSGPETCPSSDASGASCNHARVLTDPAALDAVVAAFTGRTPAASTTCAAGRGNCLTLQPRPVVPLASTIAPGVRTSGTAGFATGLVRVVSGARVTLRFTSTRALAGARVEIWTRTKAGAYRFLTSRTADGSGAVRFYAPPVTAWTAYQARFPGNLVNGPAVSPGRVAEPR